MTGCDGGDIRGRDGHRLTAAGPELQPQFLFGGWEENKAAQNRTYLLLP